MSALDTPRLFAGPDADGELPRGLIGDRQLTITQTFHIGRLTSHPIQLVPGTFIAVHGRGPRRDSNGSGKTTWLAAVSLLLGDPQWRLTSGGSAAADLLFSPTAAGLRTRDYTATDHGYVVGVFTQPDSVPITVWLRINASAPYLKAKWAAGVYLVEDGSDVRRHDSADKVFAELATSASALGSARYAQQLYGSTPRCLAWVQKRGKLSPGASLLHTSAGEFPPEEIGQSLIDLTGKAEMLSHDVELRKRLQDHTDRLLGQRKQFADKHAHEQEQLDQVQARNDARQLLADARALRRRHDALGLVEVLDRAHQIDTDELPAAKAIVTSASWETQQAEAQLAASQRRQTEEDTTDELQHEATLAQEEFEAKQSAHTRLVLQQEALEAERADLAEDAAAADGTDVTELGAQLAAADDEHTDALGEDAVARSLVDQAEAALEAARRGEPSGTTGALIAKLRSAGIDAQRLLDALTIDEAVRNQWEARLQPLRDAVVIAPDDRDPAVAVARTLPGAILVAGQSQKPPAGITDAPAAAGQLLNALERLLNDNGPDLVVAADVGLQLSGGFSPPITGRDASIHAAEDELVGARALAKEAGQRLRDATHKRTGLQDRLRSAQAAERTAELSVEASDLAGQVEQAQQELKDACKAVRRANEELLEARTARNGLTNAIETQQLRIGQLAGALDDAHSTVRELERARAELRIAYWHQRWPDNEAAARELVGDERLTRIRLRGAANENLVNVQVRLGLTSGGESAPTAEIRAALRERSGTSDEDTERRDSSFDTLVTALGDWLDTTNESDQLAEARIASDRDNRQQQLQAIERELTDSREQLVLVQDAIEDAIERSLLAISEQLDELDRSAGGFGADLLISASRPAQPEDPWTWTVTPRWRRRADGDLVAYTEQVNTAREKVFTIHLVLAALLASTGATVSHGQVLILDELGDSLGDRHRRDVLAALQRAAGAHGITVLGTCQDSVLEEAARVCGEILYFVHATEADVLNQPTRMFGFDPDRSRRELAVATATIGRPVV